MTKTVKNRLKCLENASASIDREIMRLIASGAYYDELSEDLKERYINYRYSGTDREAVESVTIMCCGSLHFPISHRPEPMSEEQAQKHIKEVAQEIERQLFTSEVKNNEEH